MVAKKSAAVSKAKNASKAVLKGGKFTLKKKKVMTSATFRRPKTKITPRKPKVGVLINLSFLHLNFKFIEIISLTLPCMLCLTGGGGGGQWRNGEFDK